MEIENLIQDWSEGTLGDFCTSTIDGTHFTPKYVPLGIPFYSVENVTSNDFKNCKYITQAEHDKLIKRCKPERGDILLTRIGAVGDTRIIDWDINASIYVSVALLKLNNKINPGYLYFYTKSNFFKNDILNKSLLNAAPMKINMLDIPKVRIKFPKSQKEQQSIAEAFSDIDELIETLKQEIDKKLTLLRALSQELLPWNFLTSLPSGWSLVTLGDSGIISGAGVDKVFRADEKEVTLINYMDVYRNDGLSKEFNYSKTTATAKQISNCSLKEKDVLFTPTSETPEDIARSSVIINDIPNAVYSYHLIRFRPLQQFDLNFLKHVFNIDDFRSQVRKSAEGSGTRYVITLPRFRRLMMPIPDLSIQSSIGSILDEASTEIKKLKIELGKYECLKQGMMNDLLTGKVRLV